MSTYAFIDVPNTTGTVRDCLDFTIGWPRLFKFLTNEKWACEEVFFYKGHKGNKEKNWFLTRLQGQIGYKVRTKLTHIHPNKIVDIDIKCKECQTEFIHKHTVNGNQKSNCDVELTVDAMNILKKGDRALILTADGDFSYLIRDLMSKGVFVSIVSSQVYTKDGKKRFSTRLSDILKEEGESSKRVEFLNIDRWRGNIEKLSK